MMRNAKVKLLTATTAITTHNADAAALKFREKDLSPLYFTASYLLSSH
jgi:hypothetical protein